MTTDRDDGRANAADSGSRYDGPWTQELIETHRRREANRSRLRRAHERSVLRRRVLPTVAVASVTLVGAGLANSFVGSTLPAATTTTTEAVSQVRQNVADARTLARLDRTIAQDRHIVASLDATAQITTAEAQQVSSSSASSAPTAVTPTSPRAQGSGAASTPTGSTGPGVSTPPSTGRSGSAGSTSGASVPTSTTPATPTAPPTTTVAPAPAPAATTTTVPVATTTVPVPVTTTTAPPTHTTTGASGAG